MKNNVKAYKIEYRFATGYGANLRYVPGRRQAFIVNAESKDQAESILRACIPVENYRAGLYKGWIKSIKLYRDGRQTDRTIDFRYVQSVRVARYLNNGGIL
jgi:hypothetical protein